MSCKRGRVGTRHHLGDRGCRLRVAIGHDLFGSNDVTAVFCGNDEIAMGVSSITGNEQPVLSCGGPTLVVRASAAAPH
ncbi:MAG: hypothetical protein ABWY68_07185 [Cryobacterium sp.]